jgi:cation diffusion facilitator family transporter
VWDGFSSDASSEESMTNFIVKHFIKDYEETNKMSVRTAYGLVASIVGIFCNVLLFAVKFIIGLGIHSVSVLADSFNNLSDAGSSIVSFVGVKIASKPADEEHPFGHGRMEYIAALIVSFLIIEVGFTFLKDSIGKISEPSQLKFQTVSIIILVLSIGVKIWLSIFNKKLGKKINSGVMLATATDCMGDALATSVTIISMLIFRFTNVNIDAYVGIGVSLIIMWAGIGIVRDTLAPLLGEAAPADMYKQVTEFVESYDGVLGTHDLIVHNYGPGRSMASVHAEVPNDVDVEISHEIIDRIEKEAVKEIGIFLVIHMDPIEVNNEHLEQMKRQVYEVVKDIDTVLNIHDFRMVDGEHQINLIFDLVVPASYTKEQRKEVSRVVRRKMSEIDQRYQCVIQVEISYVAEDK